MMALPFCPQPKGPSRLQVKMVKAFSDVQQLKVWRGQVYERDTYRCRKCLTRVQRELTRNAKRAEAHHVLSRTVKETRYDVRNGLTTCAECHEQLTGRVAEKWIVIGTKFFLTATGRRCIDATAPVVFKRIA